MYTISEGAAQFFLEQTGGHVLSAKERIERALGATVSVDKLRMGDPFGGNESSQPCWKKHSANGECVSQKYNHLVVVEVRKSSKNNYGPFASFRKIG